MRCVVLGAAGFIGGHLTEYLVSQKCDVWAFARHSSSVLDHLGPSITFHEGDVLNEKDLSWLFSGIKPQVVFHLAAQSFPTLSWKQPAETFQTNVLGTLNVLEAVRKSAIDSLIIICGSSAEYAPAAGDVPIAEAYPTQPSNPYGVSKMAQDHFARLYSQVYSLRIIRVRPFFLIGPRKTGDLCSDFAQRLIALENSQQPIFPVGNLNAVRDFLDIRDGVSAFWLLAQRGQPGEAYNLCSGKGYSIRQVLDLLKSYVRVSIKEQIDPARLRPMDEKVRIGNPGKLMALGWKPCHLLETTLRDIVSYWREMALMPVEQCKR